MATFRRVDYVEIDTDDITEWVKENLSVEEVFDKDEIIKYVAADLDPGDCFDREVLVQWAKDYLG